MISRLRGTIVSLCLALILLCIPCTAQTSFATHIVLDRETFPAESYPELQRIANLVSQDIDRLIPGKMSEFAYDDIFCYQIKPTDTVALGVIRAPITISADYRLPYEPQYVIPGRTRFALSYAGINVGQFVYQLAHEIAHVKMGVRLDNYLIETLATAVSHQVLIDMGMVPYLQLELGLEMAQLPADVVAQYRAQDLAPLRRYWQASISKQGFRMDDRPFQTLGAALIRSENVDWRPLLGVGFLNSNCPLNSHPMNYAACPPDIERMRVIAPILHSIGYDITPHGLSLPL